MLSKNKSANLFWFHFIMTSSFAFSFEYLSVDLDETGLCQFSIRAILLEALVPVMMRYFYWLLTRHLNLIVNRETRKLHERKQINETSGNEDDCNRNEPQKLNNNIFLAAKNGSTCLICKNSDFLEINFTEFLSFPFIHDCAKSRLGHVSFSAAT